MNKKSCIWAIALCLMCCFACRAPVKRDLSQEESITDTTFVHTRLFAPIDEHTHGATLVALPNGDLLAAWFQGSGERWADDVAIMGARLQAGDTSWSAPFLMADVPGFPDVNPVLFLDGQQRLWLVWYTVLANLWESSLPKYRISEDYLGEGPPLWKWQEVLHVKPGDPTQRGIQPNDKFVRSMQQQMQAYEVYLRDTLKADARIMNGWKAWSQDKLSKAKGENLQYNGYLYDESGGYTRQMMGYPLFRRIGWQTKNKAIEVHGRLLLPLYSDGLGCSLIAITEDAGKTWQFSNPLVGFENIQASLVQKANGELVAYMRDNGPPPQRLQMSRSTDGGLSWGPVRDSQLPNPGSGADLVTLANGHWVIAYNDTEEGRHSLAVSLSMDEGQSWPYTRHLLRDERPREQASTGAYPSIIQDAQGMIHLVYSYVNRSDEQGECIRYARFPESWLLQADESPTGQR